MFSLPALRNEGILEGFRLYPVYAKPRSEPRKARPDLSAKSVPISSSSDLCALCVSAFSSPNLSPFSFRLLALSVVEGSTVDRTSLFPFPNSHRITSFAYPHHLTPIESHVCKKQGRVPSASRRFFHPPILPTHGNARLPRAGARGNFNRFIRLLHNFLTTPGVRTTTHHSLPTLTVHP
jgi:hypothetical protein